MRFITSTSTIVKNSWKKNWRKMLINKISGGV